MSGAIAAATDAHRQLTAVSGLDAGLLATVGILASVSLIIAVRALDRRLPFRVRIALSVLRGLIILTCLAMLVQPTLHIRTMKSQPASVAILVDTSASMRRGDKTRLQASESLLRKSKRALASLKQKHNVRLWGFSDTLYAVSDAASLADEAPAGTKTDIRRALTELVEASGDTAVQAVVIVSDGADTEMSADEGGAPQADWAAKLGIPIHAVLIKDAPTRTDLSIQRVDAAPFAFLRSDTPIAVTVSAVGFGDREVEAFLKRDGAVLQRRTGRLLGGKARLTFNIMPFELGRRVYEVSVPLPENDEVPENNRMFFTVDVVRDKYRILHLAGRPSWDQRFLRDTLKSWPRVDLVSFYVLRTEYQSSSEGSNGMALIPFPTEELFDEHLGEFDVLIFQEFDPSEVGVDVYGAKIAEFVENGGALAIIGGAEGLRAGAFGDKSLEEIFPVRLLPTGTPPARLSDATPFRAKLTDTGASHPMTRLKEDAEENRRLWRGLSTLDGVGRVARLRDGAQSLVVHPMLNADDGPHPVLATAEAGKGRTLAICTDSFWRWRFTGPMTGGSAEMYTSFWHKAIAWLTRAPDLERLRIAVEPSPVPRSGSAGIEVELLDETYRPTAAESIQVAVSWTDADGKDSSEIFSSTTDSHGKYRRDWSPKADGAHRVRVTAGNGLRRSASFLVVSDNREQNRLDADAAVLKAISEASGGHFEINRLTPEDIVVNPAVGKEVLTQSALSLWDHPAVLGFLLLLLAAEWLLRRRAGLD